LMPSPLLSQTLVPSNEATTASGSDQRVEADSH